MLNGVDWTRAQALCNEAITIARSVGSAEIECSALNTLGAVVGVLGARDEGLELLHQSMRLAKRLGAPEELMRSYVNLGELLDQDGQVEDAAALALEGWRALRRRLASLAPALASEGASRLMRLGRWDEAADVLAQAEGALPPNFAGSAVLIRMAELETARGELEPASAHLEDGQRFLSGGASGMFAVQALAVSVALALARGRPEDARATLTGVLARGTPARSAAAFVAPAYVLGVRAEGDLAARARMRGEKPAEQEAVTRAGALLERARALVAPEASPLGPPPTELVLHVELAELEFARTRDATDAESWAAHAVRWEALSRPFQAAYARMREGEAALAVRSRERAGAAFSAARATAQRLGAPLLLRDVEELARRARIDLGGTPDGDEFRESFGLTARELEVLRLLAQGRTNAQIGQALYMSPKTASVHVSRLLAKLDVRTRTEAAAAAHRLGLTHTR
jgi:ATP/maltotriose-dependent transcriptional regulator MalT